MMAAWLRLLSDASLPHTQVDALSKEFAARADLPSHVVQLINNFPSDLHPMAQLSSGMLHCPPHGTRVLLCGCVARFGSC
jgi:citrate synthase